MQLVILLSVLAVATASRVASYENYSFEQVLRGKNNY
jgi:hypothetical protein